MSDSDIRIFAGAGRRLAWSLGDRAAYPGLVSSIRRANQAEFPGASEIEVRYGEAQDQRALAFVPSDPVAARRPVVIFVHGGSWASGAPEHYRFVGRYFASAGYPSSIIGYRHAPEFRFPVQREDTAAGVRHSLSALREYGVPAEKAFLSGHSAGAHLAALVAFDPQAREAALDGSGSRLVGVAFLSGPLDLGLLCPRPKLCPVVRRLMGTEVGWEAADPVLFVRDGDTVPVLAIHGARDPVVALASPASFVGRVSEAGGDARLRVAPAAYHANLVGMFVGAQPEGRDLLGWIGELDAGIDVGSSAAADEVYVAEPGTAAPPAACQSGASEGVDSK